MPTKTNFRSLPTLIFTKPPIQALVKGFLDPLGYDYDEKGFEEMCSEMMSILFHSDDSKLVDFEIAGYFRLVWAQVLPEMSLEDTQSALRYLRRQILVEFQSTRELIKAYLKGREITTLVSLYPTEHRIRHFYVIEKEAFHAHAKEPG
jgi:hypothetical protein